MTEKQLKQNFYLMLNNFLCVFKLSCCLTWNLTLFMWFYYFAEVVYGVEIEYVE